jgi:uridine kinase
MTGDNNQLKPEYYQTAESLYAAIQNIESSRKPKLIIGIAGESGSGKTITALQLQQVFELNGKKTNIVHMDDFFHLPPATNHEARVKDISRVGKAEVNLELLDKVCRQFKSNDTSVQQPLVDYPSNSISSFSWNARDFDILIVEGTYVLFLEHLDIRVFIDRTYHETKNDRLARGRDIANDFVEEVLGIEHTIIQSEKKLCDICIQSNFTLTKPLEA